jgi:hypothetical protein
MKILLGEFNAKLGRENIFKLTIGNESLHQVSNDIADKIENFVTLKNLVVKSKMLSNRKIHKYSQPISEISTGSTKYMTFNSVYNIRYHQITNVRIQRGITTIHKEGMNPRDRRNQ